MAVAKAKKKAKRRKEIAELMPPQAQKAAERKVKKTLDEMDEAADERYVYAKQILEVNPPAISELVEKMAQTMRRMQPERLPFVVDGQAVNVDQEILERINKKLHVWIAVRLLVASALWDIRIANFKLPKKSCARCGKKVK